MLYYNVYTIDLEIDSEKEFYMITMSQIHSDFAIYRTQPFVLFGASTVGQNILSLFAQHQLSPLCICDFREDLWGGEVEGLPVYSPSYLSILESEFPDLVVQLGLETPEERGKAKEFLSKMGHFRLISGEECWSVVHFMDMLDRKQDLWEEAKIEQNKIHSINLVQETLKLNQFSDQHQGEPLLLLCLPPKTGDHSLMNTFQAHHIPFHFVFHRPEAIDLHPLLQDHPSIKIITAVRDPIGENISLLYQIISELNRSLTARVLLEGRFNRDFFQQGGDVQLFFDLFLHGLEQPNPCGSAPIQHFVPQFQHHILDYLQHSFDQEQGYGVAKEGNVEVFTYQLEQLNGLLSPLSDFLGVKVERLESGNISREKWVAESYRQAQETLSFSTSYVEKSYDAPWVQHFYSPEQIEGFRTRWKGQAVESGKLVL